LPEACVLVTGCGGFVGRNLVPRLVAEGVEVIGVDGRIAATSTGRLRTLEADVLEPAGLAAIGAALAERDAGTLHTVHLVGLSHVATCEADPGRAHEVNVRSVRSVCELAALHGGRRFVLPSTALVYGPDAGEAVDEETPPDPGNVYATTKREAESYLLAGDASASVEPVVLRLSNLYGAGMHPDALISVIRAQLDEGALRLREYRSVRDYLYIKDAVRAFEAALFGESHFPLYNVGAGVGSSVLDVAEAVARSVGEQDAVARVPRPDSYGPVLVTSSERIRRDLGWTPEYSLDEGIADMISIEAKD
jgi:nucleoside-diphosphate-sugar epimerase